MQLLGWVLEAHQQDAAPLSMCVGSMLTRSVRFLCSHSLLLFPVWLRAGDPIELGAATFVLQPPKASRGSTTAAHHLLLSAFKSEAGHAEPAAGVMGLIRLATQVCVEKDTCNAIAAGVAYDQKAVCCYFSVL